MDKILTLRTLNYGNYGIFLIMGNAGFCPSAVSLQIPQTRIVDWNPPEDADHCIKRGIPIQLLVPLTSIYSNSQNI